MLRGREEKRNENVNKGKEENSSSEAYRVEKANIINQCLKLTDQKLTDFCLHERFSQLFTRPG